MKIVFEDDYLVVIDKPPGLVSTSSETISGYKTLAEILNSEYGIRLDRGGLAHRLDKDTSGLILAAKTPEAFDNLQSQFAQRAVKKEYLALVHGTISQSGEVKGSIGRNPKKREKFTVLLDAREASTGYEPVQNLKFKTSEFEEVFRDFNNIQMRKLKKMDYDRFTLIKCVPLTGRTHQIRVHLKFIHHPIVSDATYAGRKMYRLDHRWCPRQFLHAAKLNFVHPVNGVEMSFEAPLPFDLKKAFEFLEV